MKSGWIHIVFMPTTIQIRNVPNKLHRKLKARAALEGTFMSQYILRELKKSLERPDMEEVLAQMACQTEQNLMKFPTDAVREDQSAH